MTMPMKKILVLAAAFAGASALIAGSALAGQCPADKMKQDATKPVATAAKGVTDNVLGTIDLGAEPAAITGRNLRLRKLVVQRNGIVPWHSHSDRPAIIYIAEGEITEYASTCAVPIVHRAGDVARETAAVSHWWKNTGHGPAVLLSADLQHDLHDHNM